jgi:predicted ribosomally synthesized peptide with nif11-like leader
MIGASTRTTQAMSEEQLKAFQSAVTVDSVLQDKLNSAADDSAVIAIANQAGYRICLGDLQASMEEISDEELQGVSGGGGEDVTFASWWRNFKKSFK